MLLKTQQGLTHLILLLVIVFLGILVVVGYLIFSQYFVKTPAYPSSSPSPKPTFDLKESYQNPFQRTQYQNPFANLK